MPPTLPCFSISTTSAPARDAAKAAPIPPLPAPIIHTSVLILVGSFSVAERKERTGRNPQTGKEINIPAKKVIKFKAGKLQIAVNPKVLQDILLLIGDPISERPILTTKEKNKMFEDFLGDDFLDI